MNAIPIGTLAGIGLMLPSEPVHDAVAMLLVVLALSYGILFWAIRQSAHDRPQA